MNATLQLSALFLLDDKNVIWIWQGWWPDSETEDQSGTKTVRWQAERKAAMTIAIQYWRKTRSTQTTNFPIYLVWAGLEPLQFINLFPEWTYRDDVAELNMEVCLKIHIFCIHVFFINFFTFFIGKNDYIVALADRSYVKSRTAQSALAFTRLNKHTCLIKRETLINIRTPQEHLYKKPQEIARKTELSGTRSLDSSTKSDSLSLFVNKHFLGDESSVFDNKRCNDIARKIRRTKMQGRNNILYINMLSGWPKSRRNINCGR